MINDGKSHQIIIIKRGNEEEEGHHGGAWKIAFADFMTAMMALFLVLWLINAANEETKRSVASYFNPVKLVDRNRSSKGINDQKGGPASETESGRAEPASNSTADNPTTNSLSAKAPRDALSSKDAANEAAFFAAPIASIDAIKKVGIALSADEEASDTGAKSTSNGDFADPFMPSSSGKGATAGVSNPASVGGANITADAKTGEVRSDTADQDEAGLPLPDERE